MAEYNLLVEQSALEYIDALGAKSERICKENLKKLAEDPYPGSGKGDKERLVVDGEKIYRLHIGRTYTAFYDIDEKAKVVQVFEVLPIDEAHKRYGH
ncbi:type II toxin-antitoxin system RelE/ParE family toxin [Haloferax sp. Q22]|uniref:type II toxin-antitoxin system RelE family toxin n=1 Tax=Haloferax sp. (strain Q22) TaxID=1526048 RepID=UPI000737AFCD|nr:type II toxin-antitoxin system RelE/ParE family toxin [Haloferax sp. Q22]